MQEHETVLDVEGVAVAFDGRPVLRGVGLQLRCGELVSLLGASGGGKTTLFNVLSGLTLPDRGQVLLMPAIFRFCFLHFCTKTTSSHHNHPGNYISYLLYDIQ